MPTYLYRCQAGHEIEIVHKYSSVPTVRCSRCKRRMRKVIRPVGFVLNGGGWYSVDNRRDPLDADKQKE